MMVGYTSIQITVPCTCLLLLVCHWCVTIAMLVMTDKRKITLELVNKSFPIHRQTSYIVSKMECIKDCTYNDKCFSVTADEENKVCTQFEDERYLECGTFKTKLIIGNIWIIHRVCPDLFDLVAGGCYRPVLMHEI